MALVIENLAFRGFKGVFLRVERGECVGLTGPSGAGKTLFLRAVADLDPHEGVMQLADMSAEAVSGSKWRKAVGYLPAESAWWYETVADHFPAPTGDTDSRFVTPDRLSDLGFSPDILNQPIAGLSSGERQRLSLLRLLSGAPKALLLDEPTANLDAESLDKVERLIADYRRSTGACVIWTSHAVTQLRRVASRSYLLKNQTLTPLSV
jgi:ABC-type multidrug transport system ATPase subunit